MVIDESDSKETDVFALVALMVPIEKADALRVESFRFLRELEGVPAGVMKPPPEMHGSDMLGSRRNALSWAGDPQRFRCYEHVAELLNKHRIEILRCDYFKQSVKPIAEVDNKHHGLCFLGLTTMVGPSLDRAFVVPILDYDKRVPGKVGPSMDTTHTFRSVPGFHPQNISISSSHNLMDPTFVDSAHSALMQVTDVAAYLLHILDWERQGLPFEGASEPGVLAAAKTLDQSLVRGVEPLTMQIHES